WGVRRCGSSERNYHKPSRECRGSGWGCGARSGCDLHAGRPHTHRSSRFGPGIERRGDALAVRADDYIQEARNGIGPVDRAQKRSAEWRRYHGRAQRTRRRGVSAHTAQSVTMSSKRILVVDDEPNIGLSLEMILQGEGYNVELCRTAA